MRHLQKLAICFTIALLSFFLAKAYVSHERHLSTSTVVTVTNSFELTELKNKEVTRSSEERSKPQSTSHPLPVEVENEILRLRGKLSVLERELSGLRKENSDLRSQRDFEKRVGRSDLKIASSPGEGFKNNTYYKTELLRNVGNETAQAALQSFMAAIASGDFKSAIELSPNEHQLRLQQLDDKSLLGAYPTSGSIGIKIDTSAESSVDAEFVAEIDFGPDRPATRAHFYTKKEAGGWRVLPRVAVEGPSSTVVHE